MTVGFFGSYFGHLTWHIFTKTRFPPKKVFSEFLYGLYYRFLGIKGYKFVIWISHTINKNEVRLIFSSVFSSDLCPYPVRQTWPDSRLRGCWEVSPLPLGIWVLLRQSGQTFTFGMGRRSVILVCSVTDRFVVRLKCWARYRIIGIFYSDSTQFGDKLAIYHQVSGYRNLKFVHYIFLIFLNRYFLGVPTERPSEMHLYSISSKLPKETTISTHNCLTCPASPEARPKAQLAHQKHDPATKYASIFDNMYEDETESTPPTQETVKKKKKSKSGQHRTSASKCLHNTLTITLRL